MKLANQRYTNKVIRKLAEGDTEIALAKAQEKKQAGVTATKQKPTPVVLDPDKRIQGQSQFS